MHRLRLVLPTSRRSYTVDLGSSWLPTGLSAEARVSAPQRPCQPTSRSAGGLKLVAEGGGGGLTGHTDSRPHGFKFGGGSGAAGLTAVAAAAAAGHLHAGGRPSSQRSGSPAAAPVSLPPGRATGRGGRASAAAHMNMHAQHAHAQTRALAHMRTHIHMHSYMHTHIGTCIVRVHACGC